MCFPALLAVHCWGGYEMYKPHTPLSDVTHKNIAMMHCDTSDKATDPLTAKP